MPVRFLSDADLARLSAWPTELAADDLITFFSLTDDDVAWLRAAHRPENQLGVAVQLCSRPWLGWVPDDLSGCPAAAVARLDVGRLQLYRLGTSRTWRDRYPHAGPLLAQPIQTQLIIEHWPDLLRLVGSMKFGHTTASLLIAKLHASSRQNVIARALHELGRLVRSIYLFRHIANDELRRRVRRQLNKGESLHALRRELFFAHQGHIRRRHLDDQVDQALCLTLITNAIVLWTTTYLEDALGALRADGYPVSDEALAHLSPAQHDHINFYGTYDFQHRRRTAAPRTLTAPTASSLTCRRGRDQIRSVARADPNGLAPLPR